MNRSQLAILQLSIRGNRPPTCGYYNMERMLKRLVAGNGSVLLCGNCMDARGMMDEDVTDGVRRSTMDELAITTLTADKVMVF